MTNLLKSELFRMRHRPQSWILLVVAAILVGGFYAGFAVGTFFTEGQSQVDLQRELVFGRLREFGLSFNAFFGSVMLIIIASGLIGNEYSWNTIRPLIARARSRNALLIAKLLTMLIYAVVFTFALAALTVVMSLVASGVAGVDWGYSTDGLLDAIWYTVGLIISNLPYFALAFLLALLTKSNAAGIGGALGLSFIEPTIFGILGAVNDRFESIAKGGLAHNAQNILTEGVSSTEGWIMLGVLLLYTVIFTTLIFIVFNRRDITSG